VFCQRLRKDDNAGPRAQDVFGSRSIGGIDGENIVEPGESSDRPRAVALRQRRERRVEL
jgi:hypothetical protein